MATIAEVHGNMFLGPEQTLVCPVNRCSVMGAGLALYFKKMSSDLYRFYLRACKLKHFKNNLPIYEFPDGRKVLLFPTKHHWSEDSTLKMIEDYLHILKRDYEAMGITSIAFPMIGCGRGNIQDKTSVINAIKTILADTTLVINIYHYIEHASS